MKISTLIDNPDTGFTADRHSAINMGVHDIGHYADEVDAMLGLDGFPAVGLTGEAYNAAVAAALSQARRAARSLTIPELVGQLQALADELLDRVVLPPPWRKD